MLRANRRVLKSICQRRPPARHARGGRLGVHLLPEIPNWGDRGRFVQCTTRPVPSYRRQVNLHAAPLLGR
jgi:hypothetical protein